MFRKIAVSVIMALLVAMAVATSVQVTGGCGETTQKTPC